MDEKTIEHLEKRLSSTIDRLKELEAEMGDPEVASDPERYRKTAKEHSDLAPIVKLYEEYLSLKQDRQEGRDILMNEKDEEMRELAEMSVEEAEERIPELLQELQLLMVPKDPLDEKNVILEIRAGTGGEEAALFAGDLLRMYTRFAELKGWKLELMSTHPSEKGGFKEVTLSIDGDNVYSTLKWEGGGHRVQRVPETETQGRIHTSAATVAVLPEAEEVEIEINQKDLRVDLFCSTGPGGQSVNTTQSAVRLTHLPTGIVVSQQDEKSQIKNKAKAMKVLRARLLEAETRRQQEERAGDRKAMIGSGDRSERIRTYNFPQNRLTDHRINLTLYSLDRVMTGELAELVDALLLEERTRKLEAATTDVS